ncbi:MAG: hypothetical protein PHH09_09070 [Methanoregulaceae archaeon]|nr:hypothetical protein [Methanoregulaceae archaeon]
MSKTIRTFFGFTTQAAPDVWAATQPDRVYGPLVNLVEEIIREALEKVPAPHRQKAATIRQKKEKCGFSDDYDRSIGEAIITLEKDPRVSVICSDVPGYDPAIIDRVLEDVYKTTIAYEAGKVAASRPPTPRKPR